MRLWVLLLFNLFISIFYCQSDSSVCIWRGFSHHWSYNHRVNRLGSSISLDSVNHHIGNHFSASGTGADSTDFSLYYTQVKNLHLKFLNLKESIILSGKETKMLSETKKLTIKLPNYLQNLNQYHIVLNGFEIKSLERSDKPIHFLISVDNERYASKTHELSYDIQADWVGNCETVECNVFKNTTSYEINLKMLVIASDFDESNVSQHQFSKSYSWNKKIEFQNSILNKTHQIREGYSNPFLAIKSLSFTLNGEQWLQELNFNLDITDLDTMSKEISVKSYLSFYDWKNNMKRTAVKKRTAMLASKTPGWAHLTMNYYLFQTKTSSVHSNVFSGKMFWKGKNQSPNNQSSESSFDLE